MLFIEHVGVCYCRKCYLLSMLVCVLLFVKMLFDEHGEATHPVC